MSTWPVLPLVVFTDLDDTLFSSMRKQPEQTTLQPQAYLRDGSPISFSSPRQRSLQQWLRHGARVIPVTARNLDAYRRVQLRFDSYAVLSHGGCVLTPDGSVDTHWAAQVQALLEQAAPALQQLLDRLQHATAATAPQWQLRMIEQDQQALYVLVKHAQGDALAVQQLAAQVVRPWLQQQRGFVLHVNANNLAVIPPGIGKLPALRHVRARLQAELGDFMSVGMGDSLTDADFMLDCDFALLPTTSQLGGALRQWLQEADA